ncbi:MAG: hypothetical protein ACJAUD_002728 [Crocinitomicaceae bacterium]|jgi:hypothetical protein
MIAGDVLSFLKIIKITGGHYKAQKSLELSIEGSRLLNGVYC